MAELLEVVTSWWNLLLALLVFGFAPGFCLRLIVLAYPRSHPRRAELIGELRAVPHIERPLWVAEQLEAALFEGLAHRVSAVLHRLTGRRALDNAGLHALVSAQLAEVRASRSRIIAAADEGRRRLERDLHDGAQQRLLAVGLALQLLRTQLTDHQATVELLAEAEDQLTAALRELRELAAGIHSAVLTDQGLRPALLTLASRCPVPLTVQGQDPGRLPVPIESTTYFCTTEAVTNAVKHAHATMINITMHRTADILTLAISDDGVGSADPGSGLRGLADRVAALNGQLTIYSPPGGGTRISIELPCG